MSNDSDILSAVVRPEAGDLFCHFRQGGAETAITYGGLRVGAASVAHHLQTAGVQRGDVVVIILRHSPELLYSFLGAMMIGAIPSFMPYPTSKQDPRLYWSSHAKLFARIGTGALLTSREHFTLVRENIPDLPLRLLATEDATAAVATSIPPIAAAPDDIAFLQHSSGTTGLKKGVALSHRAVLAQVESYARALQLAPNDRIVSWLPLYHDMGLIACFMLPLITRTPVVLLDPFEWVVNPVLLFDAIKRHRGTLCWLPNFAFHHLCRTVRPSAQIDLSSMRTWIDCSEPCRAETFDLFAQRFASAGVKREHLQVCYAMAETVFAVTQTAVGALPATLRMDPERLRTDGHITCPPPGALGQTALSAGRPVAGLNVRIVDAHDTPLAEDRVGEITVSGDFLFSGYFKLEEETRRKLRRGWYHTGDLGFLHQGELYVTGRKNDLIIVHGRNYYAHEIEFLVNQVAGVHPGRNVACGWFRPEVGSEDVVIIAECNQPDPATRTRLTDTIKQALLTAAGLQVFDVHLVAPGWLVKTTSGKLSRVENLQKYLHALAEPQALSA